MATYVTDDMRKKVFDACIEAHKDATTVKNPYALGWRFEVHVSPDGEDVSTHLLAQNNRLDGDYDTVAVFPCCGNDAMGEEEYYDARGDIADEINGLIDEWETTVNARIESIDR